MRNTDDPRKQQGGVSRRSFLRGSGAAAAATALATGPGLARDGLTGSVSAPAQAEQTVAIIAGPTQIKLNINGKVRTATVEPRATLLEVLRTQLGLTGAKPVSTDGSSGASTVIINAKPVTASTTLAVACVGKKIQTIEGLSGNGPDVVSRAFVQHDAQQCGFCTPGFVVAVRVFLNKNPKATEAEIRQGLNGNICRCGTYANIIQATIAVVKGGH